MCVHKGRQKDSYHPLREVTRHLCVYNCHEIWQYSDKTFKKQRCFCCHHSLSAWKCQNILKNICCGGSLKVDRLLNLTLNLKQKYQRNQPTEELPSKLDDSCLYASFKTHFTGNFSCLTKQKCKYLRRSNYPAPVFALRQPKRQNSRHFMEEHFINQYSTGDV